MRSISTVGRTLSSPPTHTVVSLGWATPMRPRNKGSHSQSPRKMDGASNGLILTEQRHAKSNPTSWNFELAPTQRNAVLCYWALILVGTIVQHVVTVPESAFSNKRNILNTVFVKLGWVSRHRVPAVPASSCIPLTFVSLLPLQTQAWTSSPLFILMPLLAYKNKDDRRTVDRRVGAAVVRWTLATLYWAVLTQWFFGHSLFDRVLNASGSCSLDGDYKHHRHCYAEGGKWEGFDISGHCLLLVHASLLALEELMPLRRMFSIGTGHRFKPPTDVFGYILLGLGVFLAALLVLWLVMLLSTSIYFHGWAEKMLGTMFGSAFWALMYGLVYRMYGAMP